MKGAPRVVLTDRFNPFCVNRVGLHGGPFPLSVDWRRSDGVWTAHGTALRAFDFVSAASGLLPPIALAFNIGQTAFVDGDRVSPASRIAALQGVNVEVHDISWASRGFESSELLEMESGQLLQFLDGWSMYDLDLLALAERRASASIDQIVLAVNTHTIEDPPILSQLESSAVYFGGHDDCYFTVETRDERLIRAILGRLLTLIVGSKLLDDAPECAVSEPDEKLVDAILEQGKALVGVAAQDEAGDVTVRLTQGVWRLGNAVPNNPSMLASYRSTTRQWSVARL